MSEAPLEAVRALRVTDPDLGVKLLLSKLKEHQPDLEAGSKEVRKALTALKAESEAKPRLRRRARPRPPLWRRARLPRLPPPRSTLPTRAARLRTRR